LRIELKRPGLRDAIPRHQYIGQQVHDIVEVVDRYSPPAGRGSVNLHQVAKRIPLEFLSLAGRVRRPGKRLM
jgi:hypothetical protein